MFPRQLLVLLFSAAGGEVRSVFTGRIAISCVLFGLALSTVAPVCKLCSGLLSLVSITCLRTTDHTERRPGGVQKKLKRGGGGLLFYLYICICRGKGTLLYGMGVMEWVAHMKRFLVAVCLGRCEGSLLLWLYLG